MQAARDAAESAIQASWGCDGETLADRAVDAATPHVATAAQLYILNRLLECAFCDGPDEDDRYVMVRDVKALIDKLGRREEDN